MENQKAIELKQKIASLEVENPNLQRELQNQQQNARMGTAAIFVSCCLIFAAGVGLLLLPFAIWYRIKTAKKRDALEKECLNASQRLISAKNDLILVENT